MFIIIYQNKKKRSQLYSKDSRRHTSIGFVTIDIYRLTRQDTPSIEHWPKQSATTPSWLGHHMTDAGLFTLEMGR